MKADDVKLFYFRTMVVDATVLSIALLSLCPSTAQAQQNIVVFWGDDIDKVSRDVFSPIMGNPIR
jgi:hypothetical protein